MKKSTPISVLMPAYNAEEYIDDAIQSILNQSFRDFEFLIINDGSNDRTEQIILENSDTRIKYHKNDKNLGLIKSLNLGFKIAQGKYIVRMDADDISAPNRLYKQYEFMENNDEVGLLGTWFTSFNETQQKTSKYPLKHDDICLKQLFKIQLCHGTSMIRKSILTKFQLEFNSKFVHAEDFELFTRISNFTLLANIPEVLYFVRKHDKEVSHVFSQEQTDNTRLIQKRQFNDLGYPITDNELNSFVNLLEHNYKEVNIDSTTLKGLLLEIIKANKKSKRFDQKFLEKRLAYYYFHYAYNTRKLHSFLFSPFVQNLKSILKNE
jgi:glycosyltransferase involved in cell wall biosynthesis